MFAKLRTIFSHIFKYHKRYTVVFGVLLFVLVGALVVTYAPKIEDQNVVVSVPSFEAVAVLPKSEPRVLRIPKIELSSNFEAPLGIDSMGAIEIPKSYEEVGWYKYSPTPGELGPSVILGHVDSYQGPAVFYNLRQLRAGDEIFIEREDGSATVFEVTSIGEYPQTDFPTDEVYGNIPYAGLRLITCAGKYDKGTQRYSHNLVVYAKLKE